MPKPKLISVEFYVIDEDRRLYKSINDDGIYYRSPGGKAWTRMNALAADDNSAWDGPPIAFSRSK